MKPGTYYVGDLCYVMTDEEYKELCSIIIKGNKVINGELQLKDGRQFAIYSTMHGDGVYYDSFGHSYSVDSGSIGCILVEDIKAHKYENILDLGAILDFNTEFVTGGGKGDKDWEGTIQFGYVAIETDSQYEYD